MNDFAEFRHFKYLLEILLEEGLRPAAENLHTTPPNLCKQAQEFQERFQLHLYRKRPDNRITPTKTGTAFIAIARGLLEARDQAIAALQAIESGMINTLRLGSGTFVDKESGQVWRAPDPFKHSGRCVLKRIRDPAGKESGQDKRARDFNRY